MSLTKSEERKGAIVFGIVFLVVILILAIFFPNPTQFQYTVFRIILALAAAGAATMIPGFIEVQIPPWVRAGGALAVFVVVYFFNPATLVTEPNNKIPSSPPKKTVALLDSASPDVVYDDRTRKEGQTNANDIYSILVPITEISGNIRTFLVSPTHWNMQPEVVSYNPDLVIIHRSCFDGTTNNQKTDNERFDQFLRDMAKTKSQILVYTRSDAFADESAKVEWIHQTEIMIPELKGRIHLFTFRRDWQKTFRDNDVVANELRYQVRAILGLV